MPPRSHGCSQGNPTYYCWNSIRQRCRNPRNPYYHNYGGRGITLCQRWDKFANFLEDMGAQPKGKTIERINNDGNYEPSNCKWATRWEQQRNERRNILVTFGDETLTLQDWADRLDVHEETLRRWYHVGIWPKDFYHRPSNRGRRPGFVSIQKELQLQGRKLSIARWTRKNRTKAEEKLRRGVIPQEDAEVMRLALQ